MQIASWKPGCQKNQGAQSCSGICCRGDLSCWQVRPPAIVTEYMSGGSLRGALSRRLEMVQGSLTRLLIALDAAKVFSC